MKKTKIEYDCTNLITVETVKHALGVVNAGFETLTEYQNMKPLEAVEIAKSETIKALKNAIRVIEDTPVGAIPRIKYIKESL